MIIDCSFVQAENAIFQTFPKKIKEFGDVLEV